MKNYAFILVILVLFVGTSCEDKIDIEKEKEAIKAAIENESNLLFARDYEQHMKLFKQDDDLTLISSGNTWFWHGKGFKEIDEFYKNNYFESDPEPKSSHLSFKNYRIKVSNSNALVFYDLLVHDNEGTFLRQYCCVRGLEKNNDDWKIVYISWVNETSYGPINDNQ